MATVTVGCKLSNGIILHLEKDGKNVKQHIKGSNSSSLIGGHGITEGVDKAFMEEWMAKNKDLSFVKNGFVFVHEKSANAAAEAKEKEAEKTGQEPLPQLVEGTEADKAGKLAAVAKD